MHKSFAIAVLLFTILVACNRAPYKANTLLNASKLDIQTFTVDITKDNTITGAKGGVIHIPAKAIESDTQFVTLEVIEAFTIADIIRGGLVTKSNGLPLNSGGIIYLNTLQPTNLKKPFKVEIPTKLYREGMEFFKGTDDGAGSINWRNGVTLNNTNKNLPTGEKGAKISNTAATRVAQASENTDSTLGADSSQRKYVFNTNNWGWYNVGIYAKPDYIKEFKYSKLTVQLNGEPERDVFVYVLIPSEKILLDGGVLDGEKNIYGFYTPDGKIPLPHGRTAYILCMKESNGKLKYATQKFVTAPEINIKLTLADAPADVVNKFINAIDSTEL